MEPAKEEEKIVQEKEKGELEQEKELVSWTAPARPFKRRSRQFYITTVAIAGIVGLVLFLIEGFMPVILIISLFFLFYVMSTVVPEDIQYKITNKGIKVAGQRTDWLMMGRFWFSRRFNNELLVVETLVLPGRLEIVIEPELKEQIKKQVSKYLIHEEVSPSFLDRIANWFSKKLPQS